MEYQTREDRIAAIRRHAQSLGINPVEALAGGFAESGINLDLRERWGEWPDVSFGMYHQAVAWAPEGDHSASAENIAYVRSVYMDDDHAIRRGLAYWSQKRAHTRNALDAWCLYNAPGIPYLDNPNRGNYAWGLRRAQATILDANAYSPRAEEVIQTTDYTCAAASAAWGLQSLGFLTTEQQVVARLGDGISQQNGLEDGRGYGLEQVIRQSGRPYAVSAETLERCDFDTALRFAGERPVLLGGHRWFQLGDGSVIGHWVGLRHYADDILIIMNPAPGWGGITYTLSRSDWAERGPWSAVVIHF